MEIAIKGHESRGEEVIQILESLGGINRCPLNGNSVGSYYYIDYSNNNTIHCHDNKYVNKHCEKYTLEEFEKEFPFKVGDLCRYYSDVLNEELIVRILGIAIKDDCIVYEVGNRNITEGHSGIYKERYSLKPYKEMKEERNITLTLDKAKEWYKKGGELKEIALQAFTEKELNLLPRSWEEFCIKYSKTDDKEYFIDSDSNIVQVNAGVFDHCRLQNGDRNICPSKKSAEAHLAIIQLEQLRDCWRQGWIPDYTKVYKKFRIKKFGTEYIVDWSTGLSDFLVFQTEELAKEFLTSFKDLIEKAGDLI